MPAFDLMPVALKWTGLLVVAAGLLGIVYGWLIDAQSFASRWGVRYVERLDGALRSLFVWREASGIALAQLAFAIAMLAGFAASGKRLLLVLAVLALAAPPMLIELARQGRRRKLDDQVNGFALTCANALKTTASIGSALEAAVRVSAKPLAQELQVALKQMRVGSSLEEALLATSDRVQLKSLDVVISSLLIARQTGGDLPRILEETAATLRETKRLERMTHAVTRRAKFSLLVAAATSLMVAIALPLVLPEAYRPIVESASGRLILAQCALVYLAALYIGYRVTRLEV
jgi:tight adherence protein B